MPYCLLLILVQFYNKKCVLFFVVIVLLSQEYSGAHIYYYYHSDATLYLSRPDIISELGIIVSMPRSICKEAGTLNFKLHLYLHNIY